jgi:hypothetical protein
MMTVGAGRRELLVVIEIPLATCCLAPIVLLVLRVYVIGIIFRRMVLYQYMRRLIRKVFLRRIRINHAGRWYVCN